MIDYVKRLAGPYTGTGQTTFTFSFKIFEPTDVYVATALSNDEYSKNLEYGTDYSVSMNADQDATPGGTVTLSRGLAEGEILVVGSAIAYTQEAQLTNYSRFPPEIINTALDRIVIQIQQLVENLGRTLVVPPTSDTTPEEVITKLMSAQEDARKQADIAKEHAAAAESAKEEILGAQSTVISKVTDEGTKQIEAIDAKAQSAISAVQSEGDKQVDRLQVITDETLVGYGVAGHQETWTLASPISAGTSITLPNGMTYVPGRDHLRISWNGLTLYKGENFAEIGELDVPSAVFSVTFDLKAGDVLNAWIVPLGRGSIGNVESDIHTLTESVAELSRKAAFHDVN